MMQKKLTVAVVLVLGIMIGSSHAADEIRIAAGTSATEVVIKPLREQFEKASGVKLYVMGLSGKMAISELGKGTVDAALTDNSHDAVVERIKKGEFEYGDPATLKSLVVAKNRVHVIINKSNPVKALSRDQLKGIFTGKIQNWKEAGGPDTPIVIVWAKMATGTNSEFVRTILGNEPMARDLLEEKGNIDVRNSVGAVPEAIGLIPSISLVNESVKAPDISEISKDIVFYTKGNPSPGVQKLIEYIKGEGNQFIKQ